MGFVREGEPSHPQQPRSGAHSVSSLLSDRPSPQPVSSAYPPEPTARPHEGEQQHAEEATSSRGGAAAPAQGSSATRDGGDNEL